MCASIRNPISAKGLSVVHMLAKAFGSVLLNSCACLTEPSHAELHTKRPGQEAACSQGASQACTSNCRGFGWGHKNGQQVFGCNRAAGDRNASWAGCVPLAQGCEAPHEEPECTSRVLQKYMWTDGVFACSVEAQYRSLWHDARLHSCSM